MRKGNVTILASLFTMLLVAAGLGAGTFAYFSDTEKSSDNVIVAGTIDLSLTGDFDFYDVKPCKDMDPVIFEFKNVGNNPGFLYFKIDYVDHDKEVPVGSEFIGDITADEFASLIYVKTVSYAHFSGGKYGLPSDAMPDWLKMDALPNGNVDGMVSLYEIKKFGWMYYCRHIPEEPLPYCEGGKFTITFHMADSLVPFEAGGKIVKGIEDNRPQADGISVTLKAVLMQNPGPPS
jgi:predicted ribosomally synthesized peptide with SipW-like signal peptide